MNPILNESQVRESWKEFTNQEEIRSNNYLDVSLERKDEMWYTKEKNNPRNQRRSTSYA